MRKTVPIHEQTKTWEKVKSACSVRLSPLEIGGPRLTQRLRDCYHMSRRGHKIKPTDCLKKHCLLTKFKSKLIAFMTIAVVKYCDCYIFKQMKWNIYFCSKPQLFRKPSKYSKRQTSGSRSIGWEPINYRKTCEKRNCIQWNLVHTWKSPWHSFRRAII